ncbi:D-alanyl-D-alanine carboxypeptidase family protein [Microbacterium sp. JZ31]|uniref:D-alanyl-D-alanine carboxypeptidase family protein n=1 Tax=Microbacterium sp. JZ31 TaxID=1906274 RepID=UPI0019330DDB|nr:D-alanyl-D-alanine carboxypeptidase [Microbacterium sp. JZ31]
MAIDELPPRDALDPSASGDAASATPVRAASHVTADASEDALEPTQAFDVAALIALEKGAVRRAMSAEELESLPMPGGRRERRETAAVAQALGLAVPAADDEKPAPAAPAEPTTAALAWVDPATLSTPVAADTPRVSAQVPAAADLLPPRRDRRAGLIAAPLITAGALALAYVGGCALWPLDSVAPTVSAATVTPNPGHPLGVTWPTEGTAAVGAEGLGTIAALDAETVPMASIAKLVTVMMILEKAPLAVGEDGPSYSFTAEDNALYWQYRYANESALDVPIDGTLTQRQMIEGILIGSANNYIDRLTTELWGSKDAFVLAVPEWLQAHGLTGITMVDPSGISPQNTATPAALVKLASVSLADPVISEIVAMPEIELPGAGRVENTNPLLGEPGVVGIKTGTLLEGWQEQWNLLTAKDITIDQTTVRVYAAVLGQSNAELRESVSRGLLDQVEKSLQPGPSVAAGTTVATVTTEWGEDAEVVTTSDASVVLWDRGTAAIESEYDIEVSLLDGAEVGELTATGPFDTASVPLAIEGDVTGPDLGWRLTHPLDLFGLQ